MSYCRKALRVNLTSGDIAVEPLSEELLLDGIGGRGLNMRRLYAEVPPEVDAMSPRNKLFIGVGPLTGTSFPGSSRVNFSARSPQTGRLGDSNAGGFFGAELKYAGFDQVIIDGRARELSYLYIHDGAAEIRPAPQLHGLDVFATQRAILDELGDGRVQVAAVGPAAENGVKFTGIFCNLVRAAARTGMGAVLAGKNLKAVAVRGTGALQPHDAAAFQALVEEQDAAIRRHQEYQPRVLLGTTRLVHALNEAGCLATRHFQTGRFEHAEEVSGEYLAEHYKTKGKACFSCTIPCSRYYKIPDGLFRGLQSEGPEFEGLAGFSSRVGVSEITASLKGVDMCNRYGMDVITTSECIAFAMELYQRGLLSREEADGLDLSWGNVETVFALIEKIAHRQGFGDVLADGVVKAAARIGRGSERYCMHVKGLEIFQADPRGLKAYALGVALASRGGDHLRSEPSFEFTEDAAEGLRRFGAREAAFRLEYKGKGRVVKFFEERCALADSLEVCKNTLVNMEILSYEEAAALLRADTGLPFTAVGLARSAERTVNIERAYLARLGISRADDTLPDRFLHEPLPPESGPSAGSVVELAPMLDEYYAARGWDQATGLPTRQKLCALGLEDIAADLSRRGVL